MGPANTSSQCESADSFMLECELRLAYCSHLFRYSQFQVFVSFLFFFTLAGMRAVAFGGHSDLQFHCAPMANMGMFSAIQ